MIIFLIIMSLFIVVGLAFVLADALKVPSFAASKSMNNLGSKQDKNINPIKLVCSELANRLSGIIKINEYKRLQLKIDLESADINMSPEQYVSNAIATAIVFAVPALPFFIFSPFIGFIILGGAVLIYFMESGRVTSKIKERRSKIEYELPRLVANIEKNLYHSRDVLGILDAYKEFAGPELKRELEITTADMRSGNYEVALTRLEARVGSAMLADITRGLISVIRGDETSVYWGMLAMKFSDHQRQMLKIEASKAPKKVRRLSMVLLFCFMAIYIVVIGSVLIDSLGGLAM